MAQISRSSLLPSRSTSARLASSALSALRRHAHQQRRPLALLKNSADEVNLQQAAELLAQAAVKQTQGTSREAVAELKLLNDRAKLLEDKVAELAVLASKVESRLDALVKADEDAQWTSTVQTLQWAITNAELFSFSHTCGCRRDNSAILVREVLSNFITGRVTWISDMCHMRDSFEQADERDKTAFRQALSTQIHKLTGVKPRVEKEKYGEVDRYAIYRV